MLTLEALASLAESHRDSLDSKVREFSIAGRQFAFNSQPAIMGVVNLSPDSWYRESVSLTTDAAIERSRTLFAQGAAIVDIGAESTLSHAALVGAGEQSSKLLPIIKTLAAEGGIVSIETYHLDVARTCLEAGAKVLNITGTELTDDWFKLATDFEAAMILCYIEGKNVREVSNFDLSGPILGRMEDYFRRQTDRAAALGATRLFIDPGMGFYYRNLQDSSVRVRHQMNVFLNTFRLRKLGWPICHALPHAFEFFKEEVRCAEPFFAVLAALGKTDLFRTHEVPRTKAVLDTLRAY